MDCIHDERELRGVHDERFLSSHVLQHADFRVYSFKKKSFLYCWVILRQKIENFCYSYCLNHVHDPLYYHSL